MSANPFKLNLGFDSVSSRVITTFHVKYLRSAPEGPYPDPCGLRVMPAYEEDGEPEWELQRILDMRTRRRKRELLVQYVGYPLMRDCQWRPFTELETTAPKMLADFLLEFRKPPNDLASLSTAFANDSSCAQL